MPFFSIIVPVYKTEEYLKQCVDSILKQSMTDFELILVDDGSPDQCPEMCDYYAQKDQRVLVIHKENGGVSSARNQGLNVASGDYIWFVDSDDFIKTDSLANISFMTYKSSADLYVFNCRNYTGIYVGTLDELIDRYYFSYTLGFEAWNKLYRTSIIRGNGLYFDEDEPIGEDLLFNLSYYHTVMQEKREGHISFSDQDCYVYNKRQGSAMNTSSKSRLAQQLRLYEKAKSLICDNVSDNTLTYLFILHLISGINQSRNSGFQCRDFAMIDFSSYADEISRCDQILNSFVINEKASIMGKARVKAFIHEMKNGNYMFAGRIMGLK